jgi:hypothetical protein
MRALKEFSEEELNRMSIEGLKHQLAFRRQHASRFIQPKIQKLAMKQVHRIEKVMLRKVAE